jgi:WbqC-like protein family
MMTVAIMQPYFVPYAGYFRLFACADAVVMFDCVQFPRRGWVHRNRFPTASGELDWLTLPLAKATRDALISELAFAPGAQQRLREAMQRFPALVAAERTASPLLARTLELGSGSVDDYLCRLVGDVTRMLELRPPALRSSELAIDPELHAQARVLEICRRLGADRYVNLAGGRALYDPAGFAAAGIELAFLSPYGGNPASILSRLLSETVADVAAEIRRETLIEP